jgi:peptide/nickel transport system ATP-binding protein
MSLVDAPAVTAKGASLAVAHLAVDVRRYGTWVRIVDDLSLAIAPGETLGLVGESGSGKSLTASSIMGLLPQSVRVSGGSVRLDGTELVGLDAARRNEVRGSEIAMVFQDPQNSLNPAFTVGNQMIETIRAKRDVSKSEAREIAAGLLDRVGIKQPADRLADYPHQFSGGMAQRVMIALAIASQPRLLIADEPTTALDVTVQAQILRLLQQLRDEDGMSLLLISHDLSVIAEMADRVAVMYAGQVVEQGRVDELFLRPTHPYTEALLGAQPGRSTKGEALVAIPGTVPDPSAMPAGCRFHTRCAYAIESCATQPPALEPVGLGGSIVRCLRAGELTLSGVRLPLSAAAVAASSPAGSASPPAGRSTARAAERTAEVLLDIRGLTKRYPVGAGVFGKASRTITAVDDVTIDVRRGESVGLVGESGAGKSTVGRLVLGLTPATGGEVHFEGRDLAGLSKAERRAHRRDVQVVFQNPYASLDPLLPIADVIAEPLDVHESLSKADREARVIELLAQVGLDAAYRFRYPHQLSGGQRQRIAIARALALRPKLIVCDEPVSSLDVSTQAQVINLLKQLQADIGVAYLFVGHDLEVVRHISDRVAVMYLGRVVEWGPSDEVYERPRHPYTKALLASVLSIDPTQRRLQAGAPSERPAGARGAGGCPYADRCAHVADVCRTADPAMTQKDTPAGEVAVRCHFPLA